MSFRSNREILQEKANSENATDLDILKAALYESQEQYNTLARAVLNRLEAVEQSVRQSNDLAYINIDSAVKESVNGITGQIQATTQKAVADIEQYEARLKEAMAKQQKNDTREVIIVLGAFAVICFVAFYMALLCYGWWYDIPEAVQGVNNHNGLLEAINNGIYQLLQR